MDIACYIVRAHTRTRTQRLDCGKAVKVSGGWEEKKISFKSVSVACEYEVRKDEIMTSAGTYVKIWFGNKHFILFENWSEFVYLQHCKRNTIKSMSAKMASKNFL